MMLCVLLLSQNAISNASAVVTCTNLSISKTLQIITRQTNYAYKQKQLFNINYQKQYKKTEYLNDKYFFYRCFF